MVWTREELLRSYPTPIWAAAAKVYDYVNGRHVAESGWLPFHDLQPAEQHPWLQGSYEAAHQLVREIGPVLLGRLLKG